MQDYTNYNSWANRRISEAILKLTETQLDEEHPSSFNTLRKTLAHVAGAENLWLQRLTNAPDIAWQNFNALNSENLCNIWLAESEALIAYTQNLSEADLAGSISFNSLKGEAFTHSRLECILHLCNHSTFHRGQIVALLRQLGETTMPNTDFINFKRGQ